VGKCTAATLSTTMHLLNSITGLLPTAVAAVAFLSLHVWL
jgi:hypothetical protein